LTPKNLDENGVFLVEIWSDVVCPWCYIGKRRLETALARFPRQDAVQVIWHSYQLNPSAPKHGTEAALETTRTMLARKYGVTLEEADAMQTRVTSVAAQEGLKYRIELTRTENSFDAHRLIHLAATHDLQDAMKERLLAAYFTEGVSIGDRAELIRLAKEVGLVENEVVATLDGNAFADAVRADAARATSLGIQGVPFFVIAGRYGVSGAQPAEILLQAMEEAWKEREM
jgi:predicted DsbA family dithiol-disulfide isomerase